MLDGKSIHIAGSIPTGKRITESLVLTKCDYFVETQLWPLEQQLDPRAWLSNFKGTELPYAEALLNSFVYLSNAMCDALLVSNFNKLSLHCAKSSRDDADVLWREFREKCVVTFVQGETPNSSDSGLAYARKARQLLGISEDRILPPGEALTLLTRRSAMHVIFVDDFVGSGQQFIHTWHRKYSHLGGRSFADQHKLGPHKYYYCPLVCTQIGANSINKYCNGISLEPSYVLDHHYSALDANSVLWPTSCRSGGPEFVRSASLRAGIAEDNSVDDWRGFHHLGLALAINDNVPDATLPLFRWEQNGWKPLMRRR
jgi:hypothetical protein